MPSSLQILPSLSLSILFAVRWSFIQMINFLFSFFRTWQSPPFSYPDASSAVRTGRTTPHSSMSHPASLLTWIRYRPVCHCDDGTWKSVNGLSARRHFLRRFVAACFRPAGILDSVSVLLRSPPLHCINIPSAKDHHDFGIRRAIPPQSSLQYISPAFDQENLPSKPRASLLYFPPDVISDVYIAAHFDLQSCIDVNGGGVFDFLHGWWWRHDKNKYGAVEFERSSLGMMKLSD